MLQIKDLEDEMNEKLAAAEKLGYKAETELQIRVTDLEGQLEQFRDNETKLKNMLGKERSQVNKLQTEKQITQEQLKKREQVNVQS